MQPAHVGVRSRFHADCPLTLSFFPCLTLNVQRILFKFIAGLLTRKVEYQTGKHNLIQWLTYHI